MCTASIQPHRLQASPRPGSLDTAELACLKEADQAECDTILKHPKLKLGVTRSEARRQSAARERLDELMCMHIIPQLEEGAAYHDGGTACQSSHQQSRHGCTGASTSNRGGSLVLWGPGTPLGNQRPALARVAPLQEAPFRASHFRILLHAWSSSEGNAQHIAMHGWLYASHCWRRGRGWHVRRNRRGEV